MSIIFEIAKSCTNMYVVVLLMLCLSVTTPISGQRLVIPIGKPGCLEKCENSTVKIPFPFGIGENCYYNPWYEIVCNNTLSTVKPYLKKFNQEVLNISSCLDNNGDSSCYEVDLTIHVASHWHSVCNNGSNNSSQFVTSIDLTNSPFVMYDGNFLVRGCSGHASVMNRDNVVVDGCSTDCLGGDSLALIRNSTCDGIGCCSIPFTSDLGQFYKMGFSNVARNSCVEFTIGDWYERQKIVKIDSGGLLSNQWVWQVPSLPGGMVDYPDKNLVCSSVCGNNSRINGCVLCTCRPPFQGNPYLPYGCQDPCKLGTNHPHSCKKPFLSWRAVLGLSIGLGLVSLILCGYCLYRLIRRWRLVKRRAIHFKRNGGLLLQQQMTSTEGNDERTNIFTALELKNATDNFNENRILGQGGQGTVYKGMLLDGRVVAIKMSVKLDESLLQQFITEVVILSQINHRSIVKLLGCCLETEVPSLVYEFIPNGTLAQHLHSPTEEGHMSWKMRLQIAVETAEALMYLHSYSTMPIFHRDIKSSNILLDAKFRAKVSDFGTSRTIMIDQSHLSTRVQGTYGYLDPEYFQTHQFTEKSDVYSFGVVLAELLTGKKPLSETYSDGWKNLAGEFLNHMETSRLFDIVDSRILEKADEEDLVAVANLAKKCLNINGKHRPTMKDVASALEEIRSGSFSSVVN
ncbi:wall-associated receptor kinase-like 22 [Silene latifolia]|uniref:wall-associated receptor kinase-like 22 n=1 Tax=Silene latifolia TaxID=37657 RepID=UPI003D76F86D